MSKEIYILGGEQSDFALNWQKNDTSLKLMLESTLQGTFKSIGVHPAECDSVHIGNFAGELFNGQGLMAGLAVSACEGFYGKPVTRYEAACASGSMALLGAIAQIRAGMSEIACVIGVEQMRNVDAKTVASHLGCAVWQGEECQDVAFPWPHLFGRLGEQYQRRYGLAREDLTYLSRLAFANAAKNPFAQTRDWHMPAESLAEGPDNPQIDGMIRRSDCAQVTDGCAVVMLASRLGAERYAEQNGIALASIPRVTGLGHTTAPIGFDDKLKHGGELLFPHVAGSIRQALVEAGITDVFELDLIETHDCFSTTFYMAIDHFGITAPGENHHAIEAGWLEIGGRLPMNPSGGLIGVGHPVGATGVRQMLDCWRQVTGQAGENQVIGASRAAMLNLGGSATTSACFVIAR